jgi:hypothetical protein
MSDVKHDGLPIAGYKAQSGEAVAIVNLNKQFEESLLRVLDEFAERSDIDKRWLAIGRTQIEQGWMAVNRAVFQPGRVRLPTDEDDWVAFHKMFKGLLGTTPPSNSDAG